MRDDVRFYAAPAGGIARVNWTHYARVLAAKYCDSERPIVTKGWVPPLTIRRRPRRPVSA